MIFQDGLRLPAWRVFGLFSLISRLPNVSICQHFTGGNLRFS